MPNTVDFRLFDVAGIDDAPKMVNAYQQRERERKAQEARRAIEAVDAVIGVMERGKAIKLYDADHPMLPEPVPQAPAVGFGAGMLAGIMTMVSIILAVLMLAIQF